MDLGSPPVDGALPVAGVEGYLGAVAGDAEVGVLDVDGNDLPGVGGADAEPLAGDMMTPSLGASLPRGPLVAARDFGRPATSRCPATARSK